MGDSAQCAACLANNPNYHGHRSVLHYDAYSKRLVHDLKYYDKPLMVKQLAAMMRNTAPEWLQKEGAIIVPIPIHRYRMLKRKYNQSALLAKALAKQSALPLALDALRRTKHRPPQASLTRKQRLKNLSSAFEVNTRKIEIIKARPIILIDDVLTTGATLNACAKALQTAGSGRVYCLTIARTVLH